MWPQIWPDQKMIRVFFFVEFAAAYPTAYHRLSLAFLVFEFSGGGGGQVSAPSRAKVAQTPGRAWVKGTVPP